MLFSCLRYHKTSVAFKIFWCFLDNLPKTLEAPIQYRHRFSLQRKPLPNGSETPAKLCVLPAFEHRFQNQPIRWAFLKTINAQKRSATPETLWHFYPIKSSFGGNAVMVTITGKAFVIVYETNQWKWFIFGNAVACVLKN